MSAELYVYYKLDAAQAPAAAEVFAAAARGTPVRLLQRTDGQSPSGQLTWMEIYPAEAVEFEPRIAARMAPLIAGARHIERFEPLA